MRSVATGECRANDMAAGNQVKQRGAMLPDVYPSHGRAAQFCRFLPAKSSHDGLVIAGRPLRGEVHVQVDHIRLRCGGQILGDENVIQNL